MKYRDNMTDDQLKAFMREVDELHEALTAAAEHDAQHSCPPPPEWEDEMDTLKRAALDYKGQP